MTFSFPKVIPPRVVKQWYGTQGWVLKQAPKIFEAFLASFWTHWVQIPTPPPRGACACLGTHPNPHLDPPGLVKRRLTRIPHLIFVEHVAQNQKIRIAFFSPSPYPMHSNPNYSWGEDRDSISALSQGNRSRFWTVVNSDLKCVVHFKYMFSSIFRVWPVMG